MHHEFNFENILHMHQIVFIKRKQFKEIICKMSYSCFISVQIALQLLYHDKMCQHITEYWRIKGEMQKAVRRGSCGKFQYESPLRILGRRGGVHEERKRGTQKSFLKTAFLLKTKPGFKRAAVDSLDRWCQ